jgi:hypothetical protein
MSLPKVTFKDVAVLIPGISGSALAKNGREVWGTSGDRSSGPVRVNEASGLPNINVQRAAEALAFHQEIQAAQQTNSTIEEYRTTGYTIFPIVGIEQATFQSAVFDNGKLELRRESCPAKIVPAMVPCPVLRQPRLSSAPSAVSSLLPSSTHRC